MGDLLEDERIRPELLQVVDEIGQGDLCVESTIGDNTEKQLPFEGFRQFARRVDDLRVRRRQRLEDLAIQENGLNPMQVKEFREIFISADCKTADRLPLEKVQELLRRVLPPLDHNYMDEFCKIWCEIVTGGTPEDMATFPDFLRLVSRLVTSDFRGMMSRANKLAQAAQRAGSSWRRYKILSRTVHFT